MNHKKLRSKGSDFAERPLCLVEQNQNLCVSNFLLFVYITLMEVFLFPTSSNVRAIFHYMFQYSNVLLCVD